MKVLLTLVLAVFTVQVSSETNTDVIESFTPIFEKIHQDIAGTQSFTHSSANGVSRQYSSTLQTVRTFLMSSQKDAKATLNTNIQTVLEELNLSPSNEEVQKCVSVSNNSIEKMILKSEGGLDVCINMNGDQYKEAENNLQKIYGKQSQEHYVLENSKMICNSTSDNPAELKNCLYYQLFVKCTDSVKQLNQESYDVVRNYSSVLGKIGTEILECFPVVDKNVQTEIERITINFRYCCRGITQN